MPLSTNTKINLVESDPSFALSIHGGPIPVDEYLSLRIGEDYQSYTKMRRDPHVRSQLNKRTQALLARRVLVEGSKSKKATEIVNQILDRHLAYEAICSMLKGTGDLIGFSVLRMDWAPVGGFILPTFEFVPQNRFSFAYHKPEDTSIFTSDGSKLDPETEIVLVNGYELRLLTKRSPLAGERCPKGRFLVYCFDGDGSPWGLGLGYSIFPWWTVKRQANIAWMLHSDRLGSPPVLGNKPENFNERDPKGQQAVTDFNRFLASVSPNGYGSFPAGFTAEMLQDSSSSPDVHERLIQMADAQISKAVLGEVAFSDKTSGSYAANQSQVDDREASLIDADCNLLDEQLQRQLWTEIARLNYPDDEPPIVRRETVADQRKVAKESEQEKAKKDRVDRDKTLLDMGYRVKPDAVKKVYGDEYIDTTVSEGDEEQAPSLISTLQVGGTQALIGFLSGYGQSGLTKENAIEVLTTVFGVPADKAAAMLPEPPPPEEAAPTDLQGALDGALGGEGEPEATASSETTDLSELTLDRVLDWVLSDSYTDLASLDFAAAKKPSGPKKCKETSVSCGNSCQRANSKCKNKPNPEGQKAGDLLEKSVDAGGKKTTKGKVAPKEKAKPVENTKIKTKKEIKAGALEINNTQEMYDALKQMASGTHPDDIKLSAKAEKQAIQWLKKQDGYGTNDLPKAAKMKKQNSQLTDSETAALASWLGSGYSEMSQQIWKKQADSKFKENPGALAAAVYATKALHKLPPQNAQEVAKRIENWSLSAQGKKAGTIAKEISSEPWNRFMNVDNPAAFVAKYKAGETITEGNFKGITHLPPEQMSYFSQGANVVFKVKPRLDGNGMGKYVDDFKNAAKEGEILYPPGTKFRVKAITQIENKGQKVEDLFREIETFSKYGLPSSSEKKQLEQITGLPWKEAKKTKKKLIADAKANFKPHPDWNSLYKNDGYLVELEEI